MSLNLNSKILTANTDKKRYCLFCKLWEEKADSVTEINEKYFCIKNINPLDEVHLLICPKEHIESYFYPEKENTPNKFYPEDVADPESDRETKIKCQTEILSVAQKILNEQDLKSGRILINYRPPYAEIAHAHLHLLGYKNKSVNKDLYS